MLRTIAAALLWHLAERDNARALGPFGALVWRWCWWIAGEGDEPSWIDITPMDTNALHSNLKTKR